MYRNQAFNDAITTHSPRVAFRMTDIDTDEVITSVGDEALLIESNWDFVSESFVGEFPLTKMKAKFMHDAKKSYVGHSFECEVGAYTFDDEQGYTDINWMPIGAFTVSEDGQKTDEILKEIELTMYDKGEALDKRYEPLNFPLTGLQIREQIAQRAGLTFASTQQTLLYDDYVFDKLNLSENQAITDREVLRHYAQINMANGFINRYGELEFKPVFEAATVDINISNFDYDELKHEVPYGPLNSLIYDNTAEGDDEAYQSIEAKDEASVSEHGKKALRFSNNIFLDPLSLEKQQLEIDKIFNLINGFTYTPFDLEYFARPDLDPYDLIKLKGMDDEDTIVPITSMSFTYNGGLIGSLKTKELPESLPKSEIPNIFDRVKNAEIRVDRVDNRITLETSNRETQYVELYDATEKISQDVNVLDDRTAQLSLTIDKVNTSVSNFRSGNILLNGAGEFDNYDHWTFPTTNEPIRHHAGMRHAKGMTQFSIFEIRESPYCESGRTMNFFQKGIAKNGPFIVLKDRQYYLRSVIDGTAPTVKIELYDSDGVYRY